MLDTISETRLKDVHPLLSKRIHDLDASISPVVQIRITQGLRTWPQQFELYNQGRTTPGKIVTDAKPGYSAHNFGYAVDFVVMNGSLPDWDSKHTAWGTVLQIALDCGLAEGATWRTFPDTPHLYLKELPADPDDHMRAIYEAAGLEEVWKDWELNALAVNSGVPGLSKGNTPANG
jgi:peptidoglycan L-alanyl-D-glutamate endopeptidase CwlK